MGRTLPWKKDRNGATAKKTITNSSETTPPRPVTPPAARTRSIGFSSRSKRSPKPTQTGCAEDGSDKGPRQSASAPRPPRQIQESFMIQGLKHDDMWRMVEDEFVAVAHKFTAHLHEAEYQRLKERARAQNADAIRSLSRPVTGPMTDAVKRQHAVQKLRRTQAAGIRRASSRAQDVEGDDDDVDERPWAGTNLQDLMESPRKQPVPLTRISSAMTGTRAAALNRQDTISRRESSPLEEKSTRNVNTTSQSRSIHTGHIKTVRMAAANNTDHDDDDLGRHSVPAHSRPNERGHSSSSSKRKFTAAPITMDGDDDSDSPVETMFERHMRECRNNRKMPRRKQDSTPDTDKDDGQPSQKSKKGPIPSSLSIPSF